jgi:hypothetical protein
MAKGWAYRETERGLYRRERERERESGHRLENSSVEGSKKA